MTLYNEQVQVPLIIRTPRDSLPQDTSRDDVISTRRLVHTVLSAAGLASAEEQSLSLAQDPANDPEKNRVFSEAIPPQNVVNLLQKRQPDLIRDRHCDQPRRAIWLGNHKLIETGQQMLELFDITQDPSEALNLSSIFPENVEVLQDCLQAFVGDYADYAVATAGRAPGFDDPEVQQRLRDLGYLED
jgi:arylsulfatase A-like enzyme